MTNVSMPDPRHVARLREDCASALAALDVMLAAESVDLMNLMDALRLHRTSARALAALGRDSGLLAEAARIEETAPPLIAASLTGLPPRAAMAGIRENAAQRRSLIAIVLLLGILPPFELRDELASAFMALDTGEEEPLLERPAPARSGPAAHLSKFRKRYAATVALAMLREQGDGETEESILLRLSELIGSAPGTLRDWQREILQRCSERGIDFDAKLRLKLLARHCDPTELRSRVEQSIEADWERLKKKGARDAPLMARYFVSDS